MESPTKLTLACSLLAAAFGVAFCFRKPADQPAPLLVQEEIARTTQQSAGEHLPEASSRLIGRIEPLEPSAAPLASLDARTLPNFAPPIAAGTGPPDDPTTARLWSASRDERVPNQLTPVQDLGAPPEMAAGFPDSSFSAGNRPGVNGTLIGAQLGGSAPAKPWEAPSADGEGGVRSHRVADGDTLSKLAQRYLGSGARYLEIFEFNRGTLQTPNVLPIGATLRIPPRGASTAATSPETAVGEGPNGSADAPRPLAPIQPGALFSDGVSAFDQRTYRVQAEDTLASIARRFYGDPSRYPELLTANRDRLHSSDDIQEGLLLVIP